MPRIDPRAFSLLGEIVKPPPVRARHGQPRAWLPKFTPKGRELFYADAHNILCWGEKGGAKSYSADQKLVRHLYDNQNALGIIGVREWGMAAKGGAWEKLVKEVLPAFKEGMGLEYTDVWYDKQHHESIWVQNRFESWSLVVLISIPYANQIRDRMPGYEPSFVLWDELTRCESREYLSSIQAQLGRRPFVEGPQQFVGCCNPDDPEHWVHKAFFDEPYNSETGEWDPDYLTIHFPVLENIDNLQAGYLDRLAKAYKHDPTEYMRMVKGKWEARPSGESLFGELYNPIAHCRPLDKEGHPSIHERLQPDKTSPIIIGIDPGSVYNAFVFEQWLNVEGTMKWVVFDEMITYRRKIDYRVLMPAVMKRIRWWLDEIGQDPGQVWMADSSAFNQFRAAQGSYDVLELEKIYEKHREEFNLKPMKVKQAPKFNGSVIARVRLLQQLLANNQFLISSGCPETRKMLVKLEGGKSEEGVPIDPEKLLTPKRSDYVHTFDALSYPMLAATINPTALLPRHSESFMLNMH